MTGSQCSETENSEIVSAEVGITMNTIWAFIKFTNQVAARLTWAGLRHFNTEANVSYTCTNSANMDTFGVLRSESAHFLCICWRVLERSLARGNWERDGRKRWDVTSLEGW